MKTLLKDGLLSAVSHATRRKAVLLAPEASSDAAILPLRAPYGVGGPSLTIQLLDAQAGEMQVALKAAGVVASVCRFRYDGPAALTLQLCDGALSFAGASVGSLSRGQEIAARRFALEIELTTRAGDVRRRNTSHYIARDAAAVDEEYYSGDDYVDYEAESASVHPVVLDLMRTHAARGPVLEVGCATGGTLTALREAGFDVCGVDFSAWAAERARARLGDVVWSCDVERDAMPAGVTSRAPFGCFVLASVLEHFEQPMRVLEKLGPLAAADAAIVILTTNGDGFTRRILGDDWEGYFDWTHKGVDAVTPAALRRWLPELGWTIRTLRTWHVWDSSGDPTRATLRDWHAADARFRALLAERDLGDFIACVAVRTP